MMEDLKNVSDEVNHILKNLRKDGDRPKTEKLIKEKLSLLDQLEAKLLKIIVILLESESVLDLDILRIEQEKIEKHIQECREKLYKVKVIPNKTMPTQETNAANPAVDTGANTQGESFDLKTAFNIVQDFTGDPNTVRDFIDSVEMYHSLLNNSGKSTLLTFILKTKIKGAAKTKISLGDTPATFDELKKVILTRFAPKVTFSGLTHQLQTIKQNRMAVSDFVKKIESLTAQLTNLQVNDSTQEHRGIIARINEQHALNAFKSGINTNLRAVVLAANPKNFSDAVEIALEAEVNNGSQHEFENVNVVNRQNNYRNGRRSYRYPRNTNWNRKSFSSSNNKFCSNKYNSNSNNRPNNSYQNQRNYSKNNGNKNPRINSKNNSNYNNSRVNVVYNTENQEN